MFEYTIEGFNNFFSSYGVTLFDKVIIEIIASTEAEAMEKVKLLIDRANFTVIKICEIK